MSHPVHRQPAQDDVGRRPVPMTEPQQSAPFGATVLGGGQTRFRFWAPAKSAVSVEIQGRAPEAMRAAGDGWFDAEIQCEGGAHYRFQVEDGLSVPDPASRAQSGDVHGWSVVVDPEAFKWANDGWMGRPWEEAVIYEIHPGLAGGYLGVADQLETLKALGVTAVELMPVADFPGERNWGYDGVLPFAPDSAYGSPEDLKSLIDQAHGLDLMIFLDVVYNHFGPDGNYLQSYAPEFFRQDANTDWGGAIDFRRPQVRQFFSDNAVYWIKEYRFDGLRFDAVHAICDPDWLDEMARKVRNAVEPGRQVHLVLENDDNEARHMAADFNGQWNDDFHHVAHVLLTDETKGYYSDYAEAPAERLARALKEGFVYQGEPSKHRGGKHRGTPSDGLSTTAFVNFLQNHDQIGNRAQGERLTTLSGAASLRAAVALQLLSPSIPLIFMGEEIGSETQFLYFTDHNEDLAQAVRDGRRREFASFDGFDGDPSKLPDPNAAKTFEMSRPKDGPQTDDWRSFYKTLLDLRRQRITGRLRGARALNAEVLGPKAVMAGWRLGDGSRLSIAVNLGPQPAKLNLEPQTTAFFTLGEVGDGRLAGSSFAAWLEARS